MSWDDVISIFKQTFTFDALLDGPGILFFITSIVSNILTWATPLAIDPRFTYIMTGLTGVYLVIKIGNAILTGRSIWLDNKLKEKNLEDD